MVTNPNTCGLFEREIIEIAQAVHAAGAYFYCDGANFNAIVGRVRPGDLGVDCHAHQPAQDLLDAARRRRAGRGSGGAVGGAGALRAASLDREGRRRPGASPRTAPRSRAQPFGRLSAFHGQMGMFVRALAYMHEPRRRRPAPGRRGRGAVTPTTSRRALQGRDDARPSTAPACTRRCSTTRWLEGHRRHHARLRQGDDRRGLPPDDHVLPAGRARRDADRADRERGQGGARPVHRRPALAGRARPRAAPRPRRSRPRRSSPRAAASTRRWRPASRCCAGGRRTASSRRRSRRSWKQWARFVSVFAIFIPPFAAGPRFRGRRPIVDDARHGRGPADDDRRHPGPCALRDAQPARPVGGARQYQWLTWAVRVLGGAYLIYLGIRLLRSKPAATMDDAAAARSGARQRPAVRVFRDAHQSEGDRAVRQCVRDGGDGQHADMADDPHDRAGGCEFPHLVFDRARCSCLPRP